MRLIINQTQNCNDLFLLIFFALFLPTTISAQEVTPPSDLDSIKVSTIPNIQPLSFIPSPSLIQIAPPKASSDHSNNHIIDSLLKDELIGKLIDPIFILANYNPYTHYQMTSATAKIYQSALSRDDGLSIRSVLNRVPGVFMHSGALNTNRITIRGIGSRTPFATNKIRAFWDEMPLSSGEGETTIEDLDLSLFKEVVVVRGPASSLYGAGLGGAIELHSRNKRGHETIGLQVSSKFSAGSFGKRHWTHRARIETKNHLWNMYYNNLHSDGFRENNQYDREAATLTGQIYHRDKQDHLKGKLSLLLNFTDLNAFIPSSLDSLTFLTSPSQAAANWAGVRGFEDYQKAILGANYRHDFNRDWRGNIAVFSQIRNAYELRPFGILTENNVASGVRGKVEWFQGVNNRLTIGGEYFREWYDWQTYAQVDRQIGPALSDQKEQRSFYNVFGDFAWRDLGIHEEAQVQIGINLNNTRYTLTDLFPQDSIDQSGTYHFNPTFSPRIAAHFPLGLDGMIRLRALISHGFSPPSVSETLTPDGLVNPNIQPEQGWNFEVGSRGVFLYGDLQVDITIFHMAIKDLLVARRTGQDAYVGVNAGATQHRGIEFSYLADLTPKGHKINIKTHGSLTLADYRFQDFIDDGTDFSGNQLPGTPSQQFSTGLDVGISPRKLGNFLINLTYEHVGAMYLQDANTIQSSPYNLAHAKLTYSKSFKTGKLNWEVSAEGGLQNVFNEHYAAMILINAQSFGERAPRYYYPGRPRNWFGGLKISLRV